MALLWGMLEAYPYAGQVWGIHLLRRSMLLGHITDVFMAVACVDQMLLWHIKAFLVTDAVRACLYVVMAILSAVRPRQVLWWYFSVLSLGHVTVHIILSMRYLYMLLADVFWA